MLHSDRLTIAATSAHKKVEEYMAITESQIRETAKQLEQTIEQVKQTANHTESQIQETAKQLKQTAKHTDQVLGFIEVESKTLEHKMLKAIMKHKSERNPEIEIDNEGSVVIYGSDGQKLVELDGVLLLYSEGAAFEIVTLEAKHSMSREKIDDRMEKLTTFREFLTNIPTEANFDGNRRYKKSCEKFREYKFCNICNFIGALKFDASLQSYGKQKGFSLVVTNHEGFEVLNV
mmetsp:Transcript_22254/g.31969  ORF Transcript_22254/g.31969 Transcript_22254/m.31969 type:complete len:233 (-) Transcript_22254:218-916(-)